MKITRISVEGLYGLHNYDIPFDESENIKIIHAPNGYGKTTLLKLISDIMNCKLFEISIIPFNYFTIQFDNSITIQVNKDQGSKESADKKQDIKINGDEEISIRYTLVQGDEKKEYKLTNRLNYTAMLEGKVPIHYIEKNLPFLKRIAQTAWYDTRQNEKLSYDEVMAGYGELLFVDEELREALNEIREQMPVHFIHATRLLSLRESGEGRLAGRRKNSAPSVLVYSKELADIIGAFLAESAALTQELDRTFPERLIEEITKKDDEDAISLEMINEELQALEKRRVKLQEIGLLSSSTIKGIHDTKNVDKHTLKVLGLYIKDSKQKLDVFNELETKVNLLREIINKRFNYKIMQISKQGGFLFELPNKALLSPDKLSSGEQNELILIFELLFKSKPNSLILIDEPEISLHIAWQQQFLEDMQAISDVTDVNIIIATHSPDIINGRWDLTTGLEEC